MPRTDAWTGYWRTGRRASCFERSDMEAPLAHLWNEFASALPDGAKLLDLATGNGIVGWNCAATARVRGIRLHIDAVDAAAIDPRRHVSDPQQLLSSVRFHGSVQIEALPFADGAFDAVVSQFGFEYAEETQAAAEAARILAPEGRMRLVMHARDGAVSKDIGLRVERLRNALAENGPATLILTLARASESGDQATLERKLPHLAAAVEVVRQLAHNPPPDDAALFYSREFLQLWTHRDRYWPADLRRSIEDGWVNASGVAARQEQMLHAARSAEDIARIGARFIAAGLIIDATRTLHDARGASIAWLMDAHKPPAIDKTGSGAASGK
jgi:SAM-dependent methyltransferase